MAVPGATAASGLRAPAAAAAAWVCLVFAFEVLRPPGADVSLCLFHNATGLPCPTCGATRAVMAAAGGHPGRALAANPLAVTGAAAAAAWLAASAIAGRALPLPRARGTRHVLYLAAAALVAANWVYLILLQKS